MKSCLKHLLSGSCDQLNCISYSSCATDCMVEQPVSEQPVSVQKDCLRLHSTAQTDTCIVRGSEAVASCSSMSCCGTRRDCPKTIWTHLRSRLTKEGRPHHPRMVVRYVLFTIGDELDYGSGYGSVGIDLHSLHCTRRFARLPASAVCNSITMTLCYHGVQAALPRMDLSLAH